MYPVTVPPSDDGWQPLDFAGVSIRPLHTEPDGATTVLTRMAPGAVIPAHRHTAAHETVFVVSGEFVEDGVSHGPGTFFAAPAGVVHGPHATGPGCVVLTRFSAAIDFVTD